MIFSDLSKSDVDWLYLETSQKTSLFGMQLFDVWVKFFYLWCFRFVFEFVENLFKVFYIFQDSDGNVMKFGMNSSGIHILHINTVLHTFLWRVSHLVKLSCYCLFHLCFYFITIKNIFLSSIKMIISLLLLE